MNPEELHFDQTVKDRWLEGRRLVITLGGYEAMVPRNEKVRFLPDGKIAFQCVELLEQVEPFLLACELGWFENQNDLREIRSVLENMNIPTISDGMIHGYELEADAYIVSHQVHPGRLRNIMATKRVFMACDSPALGCEPWVHIPVTDNKKSRMLTSIPLPEYIAMKADADWDGRCGIHLSRKDIAPETVKSIICGSKSRVPVLLHCRPTDKKLPEMVQTFRGLGVPFPPLLGFHVYQLLVNRSETPVRDRAFALNRLIGEAWDPAEAVLASAA